MIYGLTCFVCRSGCLFSSKCLASYATGLAFKCNSTSLILYQSSSLDSGLAIMTRPEMMSYVTRRKLGPAIDSFLRQHLPLTNLPHRMDFPIAIQNLGVCMVYGHIPSSYGYFLNGKKFTTLNDKHIAHIH